MYQALHTRTHTLTLPLHSGSGGPLVTYLPIPIARAGSILRVAIECARDFQLDLLTGSAEVDAAVFPMADDAYFILSADVVSGQHYSQFALNQALYATDANLSSHYNTTIWAKISFDSVAPVVATPITLKIDSAIALSM